MANSDQLARLNARMVAVPIAVKLAVLPALEKDADELIVRQRQLAPQDDGDLKNSIRKEAGEGGLSIKVVAGGDLTTRAVRDGASATYDYAIAQEYGTAKMDPSPFFWPAFRLLRKRINNRIKRAIGAAVKAEWSK